MDCNKLEPTYKPNKRLAIAVLTSIVFHVVGIGCLIITMPKQHAAKANNKHIKSYIYHPINKPADEIKTPIKKNIKTPQIIKKVNTDIKDNTAASPKIKNIEKVGATRQAQNTATGGNTRSSNVDTAKIVNDLVHNQELNAKNNGALQSYQQYQQQKNFIPRSQTKFNQLPIPKAEKVTIKCENGFAKGLTILSGLMGGSINCERFTSHQKYIDKRLKKMGK